MVDFWEGQAEPEYDKTFLIAPRRRGRWGAERRGSGRCQRIKDPMYEEAVRVVLEMGKASTSTLQRHLRLGYGRAAEFWI